MRLSYKKPRLVAQVTVFLETGLLAGSDPVMGNYIETAGQEVVDHTFTEEDGFNTTWEF